MCLSCDNLASLVASSGFRMSRRTFASAGRCMLQSTPTHLGV
jgi:hypothetical protein